MVSYHLSSYVVVGSCDKSDTPVLAGYQFYHNYIRLHMSLEGKTPSEVAGIKVGGDNKWIRLIQNASKL
jgi:putative transposase